MRGKYNFNYSAIKKDNILMVDVINDTDENIKCIITGLLIIVKLSYQLNY